MSNESEEMEVAEKELEEGRYRIGLLQRMWPTVIEVELPVQRFLAKSRRQVKATPEQSRGCEMRSPFFLPRNQAMDTERQRHS
jgi:hypothetical protein